MLWLTRGWFGWQGMHKGSGIGVMCEMLAGALGGGYTVRPGGLGEDEPSPRARPVSINSVVAFVRSYAPAPAPNRVALRAQSSSLHAVMLPADDLTILAGPVPPALAGR